MFVSGVPRIGINESAVARRFIVLVDSLYEHRCKLVCSAQVGPDQLFPSESDGAAQEEVFAFRRAASRLHEMQGARYLKLAHVLTDVK